MYWVLLMVIQQEMVKKHLTRIVNYSYIQVCKLGDIDSEDYDVIEKMEEEWPEMTKEFKKIQREQYELFLHKQHDYGPGNISVGTQLQTPEEIKLSLTGLWFRMNDKLQRVKTLLMTGRDSAVKDEPLEDAYLDVSNYGIMATIVGRGKWGK